MVGHHYFDDCERILCQECLAKVVWPTREIDLDRGVGLYRMTVEELKTWVTPGTSNYREFTKRPVEGLKNLLPQLEMISALLPKTS